MRPWRMVEVIDVDEAPDVPRTILGTPTYVLGDRVLSMGNPLLDDLLMALDTVAVR